MSNKPKLKNPLEARHRILQFNELNGVRLLAPASFWMAAPGRRKNVCNGCGPGGWKWDIIPDTMYGLSIHDACDIHDWMYCHGVTEKDKEIADHVFKENLYRIIDQKSVSWLFRKLRHLRAWVYFLMVAWFGDEAFWKGKRT